MAERQDSLPEGQATAMESGTTGGENPGAERGERRPRERSRERRERRPREDDGSAAPAQFAGDMEAEPTVVPAEPVSTPVSASGATAPAPQTGATRSMPLVQSFALPLADMQALASSAGLEWVNSDPARVSAIQAAIAAEPRPIHVPRERPPLVVLDEGPLVLVETRKDLGAMGLPFQ